MTELVAEAADALERRLFFERLSSCYEALCADATMWSEIEPERADEAAALGDPSA